MVLQGGLTTEMIINVREDSTIGETEVSIVCRKVTAELEEIIANLSLTDNTVAGKADGETYFIPLKNIFYFESVENKIFANTENRSFECPAKLYQLEQKLENTQFARISKTMIADLKKVKSIRPDENCRLIATLTNGEKLVVSRLYVPVIKNKLGVN